MNDDFDTIVDEMMEINEKNETYEMKKGKNARSEVFAYGYHFDSKEELDIYEWILEAKNLGFIECFEYQPDSFVLYEGFKNQKGKYVVRPHIYTADFKITFTDNWNEFREKHKLKFFDKFDEKNVYIDVKGTWSRFSDGRDFQLNLKWMLYRYNIYVWKIIPLKFFEKTWLPKNCVLTRKTKKISKKYSDLLTFEHKFKYQPCLNSVNFNLHTT